jgi:hypothetical protein
VWTASVGALRTLNGMIANGNVCLRYAEWTPSVGKSGTSTGRVWTVTACARGIPTGRTRGTVGNVRRTPLTVIPILTVRPKRYALMGSAGAHPTPSMTVPLRRVSTTSALRQPTAKSRGTGGAPVAQVNVFVVHRTLLRTLIMDGYVRESRVNPNVRLTMSVRVGRDWRCVWTGNVGALLTIRLIKESAISFRVIRIAIASSRGIGIAPVVRRVTVSVLLIIRKMRGTVGNVSRSLIVVQIH